MTDTTQISPTLPHGQPPAVPPVVGIFPSNKTPAAAGAISFESVFEHAAIGTAIVGLDGLWLRTNRSLCGMLGCSEAELAGTSFHSLTHPDDRKAEESLLAKLAAGRVASFDLEKRCVTRSGQTIWTLLSVSALGDGPDAPKYFVVQLEDLTSRKHAAQALAETQELYRRLVTGAPVGLFQTDAAGNYTFVGEEWCRISGVEREAALGKNWLEQVHPEDRPTVAELWQLANWQQSDFAAECRFVMPAGTTQWVACAARPLRDAAGAVSGHVGTVADMTGHKQAELELQRSERQYKAAFDADSLARAQLDLSTARFLKVNAQLCQMMGYSEAELAELSFLDLTHPADREHELEALLDMIAGRATTYCRESRYVRKDGQMLWVSIDARVIEADETGPRRTVATIHDITARKDAEWDQAIAAARLRKIAETDELTSLPNRRHLTTRLQEIWQSAVERQELGCLVVNLDHFKMLNESLGRAAGDAALSAIAALLRQSIRPSDCCCRLAGDEFVILTKAAPPWCLNQVAERLQQAIAKCQLPGCPAEVRLTASIGVAAGCDWPTWEDVLAEADRRLGIAKREGRNRVGGWIKPGASEN